MKISNCTQVQRYPECEVYLLPFTINALKPTFSYGDCFNGYALGNWINNEFVLTYYLHELDEIDNNDIEFEISTTDIHDYCISS